MSYNDGIKLDSSIRIFYDSFTQSDFSNTNKTTKKQLLHDSISDTHIHSKKATKTCWQNCVHEIKATEGGTAKIQA